MAREEFAGPGSSRPNTSYLRFEADDAYFIEATTMEPTNVISSGTQFYVRVEMGVDGPWCGLLAGHSGLIQVHFDQVESANKSTPPGVPFTWTPAMCSQQVNSIQLGPYSLNPGTYRATVQIRWNPPVDKILGGFIDGLVLEVL